MYSSSSIMSVEAKGKHREKFMTILILMSNKNEGNDAISSLSSTMWHIK